MDLRQIKTFVHIAELRSYTKAAAFLYVSQPALSRQMRLLEEELDTKLFHRHGHGVELTADGAAFLERCHELLADFEQLRHDFKVRTSSTGVTGTVSVGLPVPSTRFISPRFLDELRASYPGVSVRVVEGFSALLHEWLISGSLDLAVLFEPRTGKLLTSEPLLVEDLFAIVARGRRKNRALFDASDLGAKPLILPHRPHVIRDLVDGLNLKEAEVVEIDSTSLMIELARAGVGTAILPQGSVDTAVRAGDVLALPIVNPALSWQVMVCQSSVRPLTPAASIVLGLLRQEITSRVRAGDWTARLIGAEGRARNGRRSQAP
ncbi:LysR family transcriptional regulator [Ramlibacter algicola]|uniref:LysR family transcriptional regulator n=1 Tax=Ramlibacter algicola TaxID=2795217 RepID=A0A934PZZ1_9BURK|nr:LysR family transcriptional regulator [Ramlibacter algicola]MBK0392132.1 LysR family transcriptional regulator [Ramlibacter algicola]